MYRKLKQKQNVKYLKIAQDSKLFIDNLKYLQLFVFKLHQKNIQYVIIKNVITR